MKLVLIIVSFVNLSCMVQIKQVSEEKIVKIINPSGEQVEIEVVDMKFAKQLKRKLEGKLISNDYDVEERELFLLENSKILHIYGVEVAHVYKNIDDYLKIYANSKVKNFIIHIDYNNSNNNFQYSYCFEFKYYQIETYLNSVSLNKDTTFANIDENLNTVYAVNNGNYILVNDKKNELYWYPDKLNFEGYYNTVYVGW